VSHQELQIVNTCYLLFLVSHDCDNAAYNNSKEVFTLHAVLWTNQPKQLTELRRWHCKTFMIMIKLICKSVIMA